MSTKDKIQIAFNKVTASEYAFSQVAEGKYSHNGKELTTKLECTEDGFMMMTINDKSYPVEIISAHQNSYEILVNGVGYNFSVESPFSLERLKVLVEKADQSTTIRLKAPMPGKILEVLVKAGDSVKAGDTLVILEAMKMQNAILASTKGTIKKVLAKEGDNTSKSDLLIEMEKER